MKIQEFVWLEDRVNHISGHGITPDEVEEVCFGQAYVQRAKSKGIILSITSVAQQKPGDTYSVL